MLKLWNVSLVLATASSRSSHVPRALRHPGLDSRFGASTLCKPFLGFHRPAACRVGGAGGHAARRPTLHRPDRRSALARNGLPVEQLRAGRPLLRDLWGTFFPLISEAATGTKASAAALVRTAIRRRSRWCSCCCRDWARIGLGRVRLSALCAHAGRAARRGLLMLGGGPLPGASRAGRSHWGCFAVACSRSPVWARSCSSDARPAHAHRRGSGGLPLRSVVARNRRRYGGVRGACRCCGAAHRRGRLHHFQHVRDVRLRPGRAPA